MVMDRDKAEAHLAQVIEERQLSLTSDDYSWAFESAQTGEDAVQWVNEYLGHETLLTKEELELLVPS